MSRDQLLTAALALPEEERAALAHDLLLSLAPDEVASKEEWEQAWAEELQLRASRYERGETTARDWREVLAEVRASLARGKA